MSEVRLAAITAIGMAIATFFVFIEIRIGSSGDSALPDCEYVEVLKPTLGVFSALIGVFVIEQGLIRRDYVSAVLGAPAIGLGAYHVASGLGVIGAPCA